LVTYHYLVSGKKIQRKGRSNHRRAASSSGFYPVAAAAISEIYNIPISTASDYKRLAKEYGFLEIKKSFTDIPVPLDQLNHYRKSVGYEIAKKILNPYICYENFPIV